MSTEGTARSPLILADGYSYTELIPVPDSPSGFIRIFHAFFSLFSSVSVNPSSSTMLSNIFAFSISSSYSCFGMVTFSGIFITIYSLTA